MSQRPLSLTRRALVSAAGTLVFAPAALAQPLSPTPRQTEGPFYPVDWAGDVDNDLVVVRGEAARAQGQIAHVMGRVFGPDGAQVAGATVEIWQCDAGGRYLHPGDMSFFAASRDKGFQGRGRTLTSSDGSYRFRTIRPVAYSGRAPHIHFRVKRENREVLTTQLYVAGDPDNARDGLLARVRNQDAIVRPFAPANGIEQGALAATFDIRLG